MKVRVMDLLPGLIGAAMGGVFGYFIYKLGLQQGLKAGVVPGAFVGLGGGLLSSRPSQLRGVICGLGALALGIFAEWWNEWFNEDPSLGFFLTHMNHLRWLVLVMIALGTFLGYYWGGQGFKPDFAGKPSERRDGLE
jgi:H+/Cl- antiporter ClcA